MVRDNAVLSPSDYPKGLLYEDDAPKKISEQSDKVEILIFWASVPKRDSQRGHLEMSQKKSFQGISPIGK